MREIGGFIEFETSDGKEYYEDVLALNCGRNALIYLIEKLKIKTMYIPYFICSSVSDSIKKAGAELIYYHIDQSFNPLLDDLSRDDWLYIVNYYGQISDEKIRVYKEKCNIIVDNAQAFFHKPNKGIPTIYTCRKYFGVPDGAYLAGVELDDDLESDFSYERMRFLLGRYEKGANEFYSDYVANNQIFCSESVKAMSKLTHNLLRGIDYTEVRKRRTRNFAFLHATFANVNKLFLSIPEGAFMYPLYVDHGAEIRKGLQKKNIYIPTLWPDVFSRCDEMTLEYDMAKNILPLPIDQRYGIDDMEYMVLEIKALL